MPQQSLRVPVAALIEAAEAERARIVAEHAKLKSVPTPPKAEQRRMMAAALRVAANDIAAGRRAAQLTQPYDHRRKCYGRGLSVSVSVALPDKVPAHPDTEKVDRDLRMLRATSQETVAVRADSDFARYV